MAAIIPKAGERQVADTLADIRADHVARYRWAAERLAGGARVVDAACGCGYGAAMAADAGARHVMAIDRDAACLSYGARHWGRPPIEWQCHDLETGLPDGAGAFDLAVCFETIEHLADPAPLLSALAGCAGRLVASVPNEAVIPKLPGRFPHHFRHYTRAEFEDLLAACGWRVTAHAGQRDATAPVETGIDGRTLVAEAVPA